MEEKLSMAVEHMDDMAGSIFLSSRKYFDITKQKREGLFKSKARKAVGQDAKESYGISAIGDLKKW